jgi:hypothetical protein
MPKKCTLARFLILSKRDVRFLIGISGEAALLECRLATLELLERLDASAPDVPDGVRRMHGAP